MTHKERTRKVNDRKAKAAALDTTQWGIGCKNALLMMLVVFLFLGMLKFYSDKYWRPFSIKEKEFVNLKELIKESEQWRETQVQQLYLSKRKYLSNEQFEHLVASGEIYEQYASLFQSPRQISLDKHLLDKVNAKWDLIRKSPSLINHTISDARHNQAVYIFHSNGIEGNTLTLAETRKIVDEGLYSVVNKPIKDVLETVNHVSAFEDLLEHVSKNTTITLKDIQNLHISLMTSLSKTAGLWRQHNVGIGYQKTLLADYYEVPELMKKFISYFNDNDFTRAHPVVQACLTHYNFVRIHPFSDGNGRMSRMLMNLVLLRNNLPMAIIKKKQKGKYFESLEHHFEASKNSRNIRSEFCNFVLFVVNSSLDSVLSSSVVTYEEWRKLENKDELEQKV